MGGRAPVVIILFMLVGLFCHGEAPTYFGEPLPGLVPEPFAPDRLTCYSLGGTFDPELSQFYCTWQDELGTASRVVGYRTDGDAWIGINRLAFVATAHAIEPHISPDGTALYYTGLGPRGQWIAYVSDRTESGWSRARPLPAQINTSEWTPMYLTSTLDGTLYFTQVSLSQDRIVRCRRLEDGAYAEAEPLGDAINGSGRAAHPFISPDESFLLFDSPMGPQSTGYDIYISRRMEDGSWSEPENLVEVNTTGQEICPVLTPDGAYLLFTRNARIHWVDARVLDSYLIEVE